MPWLSAIFWVTAPGVQATDPGVRLKRRGNEASEFHSAPEVQAEHEFLQQLLGRSALLNIGPYVEWMRKRTHLDLRQANEKMKAYKNKAQFCRCGHVKSMHRRLHSPVNAGCNFINCKCRNFRPVASAGQSQKRIASR
jgi:hypothetical protein